MWDEILRRKLQEVDALNKQHASIASSDIRRRLSFAASEGALSLSKALRRYDSDGTRNMAVIGEVKRRSPHGGRVASYTRADDVARELSTWPVDVLSICTDAAHGGRPEELAAAVRAVSGVPVLAKDVVLEPIQIAAAAEAGASGVLLIATILGSRLEQLIDTATLCGIEAAVEVHTPRELTFALSCSATLLLVNNRDRVSGKLYPNQALGLRDLIPPNVVAAVCSGVSDFEAVRRYASAGYDAVVLGQRIASPTAREFVADLRRISITPLEQLLPFGAHADLGFSCDDD